MSHQQLSLGSFGAPEGADEQLRAQAAALVGAIERARRQANLSHRRLAARAGLPASTVRSALSEQANPQLETLLALALALGLQLALTPAGAP